MIEIPLTNSDKVALIDDEDYERVSQYKWRAKVLVVIQTDGQENDSAEFDQKKVFEMIKERSDKGWTFVFLGADQDAFLAGGALGITKGNTLSYQTGQTQIMYSQLLNNTTTYTRGGIVGQSCCDFFNSNKTDKDKKDAKDNS